MKIDFFLRLSLVFYLFTFLVSFPINAQVDIARWDFESLTNSHVTSPAPSIGTGAASIVGSMSTSGSVTVQGFGNCNSSINGGTIGWQISNAAPGSTSESSGVQFMVSTVGYSNIQFYFDNRLSNTSVRTRRIQYTLNGGASWINLDLVEGTGGNYTRGCTNQGGIDNGKIDASNPVGNNSGERWTRATIDFSAITSANENSNFGVRILAAHYSNTGQFRQANNSSNFATAGTWRFDNVAFQGTALIVNPTLPFSSCNLLVYRVGNSSTTLDNAANQVSLMEVSSAGALVQTVNNFTGSNLLTQSGSATSNGFFNTYNGFVGLPGHNEAIGTASVNSNNSKRTIISDNNLNYYPYNLPVTALIPFNSDNFRSVVPTSVNTFYASGNGSSNNGGIWYFNGSTYLQLLAGNVRNIEIYTLFFCSFFCIRRFRSLQTFKRFTNKWN
jgi:hypothetical protein